MVMDRNVLVAQNPECRVADAATVGVGNHHGVEFPRAASALAGQIGQACWVLIPQSSRMAMWSVRTRRLLPLPLERRD